MTTANKSKSSVVKTTYFANWADIWGFPLAYKLVPLLARIPAITPNKVTLFAFTLFVIASISLFLKYPYHYLVAALLFPLAFLGDDIDGQLARYTKQSSEIGDYLDKTLDVLKIFIVTFSLSIACYITTGNVLYIFLGFIACFFFNYRYYIKLETMFHEINNDTTYLKKSDQMRIKRTKIITDRLDYLNMTFLGRIKALWLTNRLIFLVDEAEFCVIAALAALFNRLELGLWIIAIAQVSIASWRLLERGYQIKNHSERLLWPMRK